MTNSTALTQKATIPIMFYRARHLQIDVLYTITTSVSEQANMENCSMGAIEECKSYCLCHFVLFETNMHFKCSDCRCVGSF